MPAPRAVLHEIDELGLSHALPWTHAQLEERRRWKHFRDTGWVLVAYGSEVINPDGSVEVDVDVADVDDE